MKDKHESKKTASSASTAKHAPESTTDTAGATGTGATAAAGVTGTAEGTTGTADGSPGADAPGDQGRNPVEEAKATEKDRADRIVEAGTGQATEISPEATAGGIVGESGTGVIVDVTDDDLAAVGQARDNANPVAFLHGLSIEDRRSALGDSFDAFERGELNVTDIAFRLPDGEVKSFDTKLPTDDAQRMSHVDPVPGEGMPAEDTEADKEEQRVQRFRQRYEAFGNYFDAVQKKAQFDGRPIPEISRPWEEAYANAEEVDSAVQRLCLPKP